MRNAGKNIVFVGLLLLSIAGAIAAMGCAGQKPKPCVPSVKAMSNQGPVELKNCHQDPDGGLFGVFVTIKIVKEK